MKSWNLGLAHRQPTPRLDDRTPGADIEMSNQPEPIELTVKVTFGTE